MGNTRKARQPPATSAPYAQLPSSPFPHFPNSPVPQLPSPPIPQSPNSPSPQPPITPRHSPDLPVVLTIAGSDSGGGAGIQADLKTLTALGTFGASAITCITAQNPDAVTGIEAVSARMVERQIEAVTAGFPVAAVKTGMLYSAAIVATVARALKRLPGVPVVVDPVMVATSGARLLRQDAQEALCRRLLPLATVVTPNLQEAEILAGHPIRTLDELVRAAETIARRYGIACLAKGGHLSGRRVFDVLATDGRLDVLELPRIRVRQTHGTGCTFSAALAAGLARELSLKDAALAAKDFVAGALEHAAKVGRHSPLRFMWMSLNAGVEATTKHAKGIARRTTFSRPSRVS